ncbi:MAG: hypothetical protein AAB337_03825 [Patescibacteria group bacterium]
MHIYRDILKQAVQTTWHHKELWFFGLFAGLLNTGSVIDVIVRLVRDTLSGTSLTELVVRAIPGLSSFVQYLQTLSLIDTTRQILTGGALVFGFVLLLLLSINGQANLFHRLKQRGKNTWWHPSGLVLVRLLGLNALWRIALALVHVFSTAVISSFVSTDPATQVLVTFAMLVVTIPLTLLLGCLTIFAMIEIVTKKKTILIALGDSWNIIRHHLTAVTEVAVLLFLVGLLGTLILIGAIFLLAIPYLFLLLLSLAMNSMLIWMIVMLLASVSGLILVLAFGGFMTSLVYATWYGAYQKFAKRTAIVSKLERMVVQFKLIR